MKKSPSITTAKFALVILALTFAVSTAAISCDDFANGTVARFDGFDGHVIESPHPYCNNTAVTHHVAFNEVNAIGVEISFDNRTHIEEGYDSVTFFSATSEGHLTSQKLDGQNIPDMTIDGPEFDIIFESDGSVDYFGYSFTATPIRGTTCAGFEADTGAAFDDMETHTIRSPHPYCSSMSAQQHYSFTNSTVTHLNLIFDGRSHIETNYDSLIISYSDSNGNLVSNTFEGENFSNLTVQAAEFDLTFTTDSSYAFYGFEFDVTPLTGSPCSEFSDAVVTFDDMEAHSIQSSHPYCNNLDVSQHYEFSNTNVTHINVVFDSQSQIESNYDSLTLSYTNEDGEVVTNSFDGVSFPGFTIQAREFDLTFTSDSSTTYFGYSFEATPATGVIPCADFISSPGATYDDMEPHVIKSAHPYCNSLSVQQHYSYSNSTVTYLTLSFDDLTDIESYYDTLTISYTNAQGTSVSNSYNGSDIADITVAASEFDLSFTSDSSVTHYGYNFTVAPFSGSPCDNFSDNTGATFDDMSAQTIASSHPYCNSLNVQQHYAFTAANVTHVSLTFDSDSYIESYDSLVIAYTDDEGQLVSTSFSGTTFNDLLVMATEFDLTFTSDSSVTYYGFSFEATPQTGSVPCGDFMSNTGATFDGVSPQVIESAHPYCNDLNVSQHYSFSNSTVTYMTIEFDSTSHIESYYDSLVISYTDNQGSAQSLSYSGENFTDTTILASEFDLSFTSDSSYTFSGYTFTITPLTGSPCDNFSDSTGATFADVEAHTVTSPHPYCNNMAVNQHYSFSNSTVTYINIAFDSQSHIENNYDSLVISYTNDGGETASRTFSGSTLEDFTIQASEFDLVFSSDSSVSYYGFELTATPMEGEIPCGDFVGDAGATYNDMESHDIESAHPYCNNLDVSQHYSFSNSTVDYIQLEFDDDSYIESFDSLVISYTKTDGSYVTETYAGTDMTVLASSFDLTFTSDSSITYYGYEFTATPNAGSPCGDFSTSPGATFTDLDDHDIESPHPYCNSMNVQQHYAFSNANVTHISVEFESESQIENYYDSLVISYTDSQGTAVTKSFSGSNLSDFVIDAAEFDLSFTSDSSVNYYGFSFEVVPETGELPCDAFSHNPGATFSGMGEQTIESSHPYCNNMAVDQHYSFSNSTVTSVTLEFDDDTFIESYYDSLVVSYTDNDGNAVSNSYSGQSISDVVVLASEFDLTFTSDSSNAYYGYEITATPHSGSPCSDFSGFPGEVFDEVEAEVIESSHPYCNNLNVTQHYSYLDTSVNQITLEFDSQTHIENSYDALVISYTDSTGSLVTQNFSGQSFGTYTVEASAFDVAFTSDSSVSYYGYSFTATPTAGPSCDEFSSNTGATFSGLGAQTIESSHPYCNSMSVTQQYSFSDSSVQSIVLEFDSDTDIEDYWDTLEITYSGSNSTPVSHTFQGSDFSAYTVEASDFSLTFHSDSSVAEYGYAFTATPQTATVATARKMTLDEQAAMLNLYMRKKEQGKQ